MYRDGSDSVPRVLISRPFDRPDVGREQARAAASLTSAHRRPRDVVNVLLAPQRSHADRELRVVESRLKQQFPARGWSGDKGAVTLKPSSPLRSLRRSCLALAWDAVRGLRNESCDFQKVIDVWLLRRAFASLMNVPARRSICSSEHCNPFLSHLSKSRRPLGSSRSSRTSCSSL